MMRGPTALALALSCLVAHPVWAAASPRRQALERARLLGELDAATLGLENEFTQPRPKGEAALHGTVTLQYTAPVGGQSQGAAAMVQGDALLRHGRYGLSLTPRLKIESLAAPVQSGSLFFQQAYAFVAVPTGEVKLGKVLAQLGRLWDFSLFGPAITNYDYKLTPDLGVSLEGQFKGLKRRSLSYALQYFAFDGRTFSVANDTLLSARKARRRHNVTARVVPQGFVGPVHVAWGLSAQTYQAVGGTHHPVWRAATDVDVVYKWLEGFVEVGRQASSDVSSMNLPVSPFNYLWAGTQASVGPARLRVHVNTVRHEAPSPGWGVLLQPGAEYVVGDRASVVVEGAAWMAQAALPMRNEQNVFVFVVLHD
jgi:hypothetical protein